jgi:hypothetical protein
MSLTNTTFSTEQLHTLCSALRTAIHKMDDDSVVLRQVALQLRDGEQHPFFANGEDGAGAADAVAANKEYRADEFRDLLDAIEEILDL